MNRSALFMVTSDPIKSHLPSEAIRIAAGILPWRKIKVQIYFHRPFVQALLDQPGDLIGLDPIQRFYPILDQEPHTALGPEEFSSEFELAGNYYHLNSVSPARLNEIQTRSTWLLHF